MDNPQASLPIHLQYRKAEEVVRAEAELESTVSGVARKLATSNHIPTKQFAEQYLMPVIAHIVKFFSMQHADLLVFVQRALLEQGEGEESGEALVGIPQEDVDAIVSELERLDKFLVRLNDLGGNKKIIVEEIKKEAKQFRLAVSDIMNVVQDYSLEEADSGDDDYLEFEDDDEEPGDESILESTPEVETVSQAEVVQ